MKLTYYALIMMSSHSFSKLNQAILFFVTVMHISSSPELCNNGCVL
uniref:Uncharacterized protein n=1 Tax=Anguilla anguilla TaxID=7936 RepID=A0A0E9QSJ3_ANGAN